MNTSSFKNILIGVLAVAVIVLGSSALMRRDDTEKTPPSPAETKTAILAQGQKVLTALKNKDAAALSALTHPTKGVRFSPYAYVDIENDVSFSAQKIATIFSAPEKLRFGDYDGSGEPMELTFSEYYDQFIYDRDFLSAPQTSYDERLGQGNSLNNLADVYPTSHVTEYHFPGFEAQYEGMDWESLRLVFEEMNGSWYLVGVAHDQWTI